MFDRSESNFTSDLLAHMPMQFQMDVHLQKRLNCGRSSAIWCCIQFCHQPKFEKILLHLQVFAEIRKKGTKTFIQLDTGWQWASSKCKDAKIENRNQNIDYNLESILNYRYQKSFGSGNWKIQFQALSLQRFSFRSSKNPAKCFFLVV